MELFLVDTIRPFWVKGINSIAGRPTSGVREWIRTGGYYFDNPTTPGSFSVSIRDEAEFLNALASDINRFSLASFESASHVSRNAKFPKAVAWLLISSYYSGFFAAHAILRLLGASCIHIDGALRDFLNGVADTGGMLHQPIKKGFYTCRFSSAASLLECDRSAPASGGVHESFWETFIGEIEQLRESVLLSTAQSVEKNRLAYARLGDLQAILTSDSHVRGTWLSSVRNKVNYAHLMESWYPYRESRAYYDQLFRIQSRWYDKPEVVPMGSPEPLIRFMEACCFMTALCKALTDDLTVRCVGGTSFLATGVSRFLRLAL
jgi:hypothetical protein